MPTSNIKPQTSSRVSRLTLCVLCFTLYVVLGSCKTYWPTEARTFEPSLAIEALLVDGQPVDSVWVRLSYGILESQPKTQKVYDSAFIVVYTGSKSDTLAAKDSLPNCFQASDANFMVRTGETYYLYAEIYNAEVETLKVRARTTVPDSFSCVPLASVWLADTTKA
ncbi:MAG: hypothetical protein ACYSWP_19845, partial [Planctomycetota bacterium]